MLRMTGAFGYDLTMTFVESRSVPTFTPTNALPPSCLDHATLPDDRDGRVRRRPLDRSRHELVAIDVLAQDGERER